MPNPESKDENPKSQPNHTTTINVVSSSTASTITAGIFHIWDRAQFLAMCNKRPFLAWANFTTPFQGLLQTMCHKPISGGLYYFGQSELQSHFLPFLRMNFNFSESQAQFSIGLTTGAFCGIVTNPLSCIKANAWQDPTKSSSFFNSLTTMWKDGGITVFTRGTAATVYRDMIFGGVYEYTRNKLRTSINTISPDKGNNPFIHFASDAAGAGLGTIASSFFNYARTRQHGTPPEKKPPTILESVTTILKDSKKIPSWGSRISFFQKSLCLGPGVLRVAGGMAIGQLIVDGVREKLKRVM